MRDIDISLQLIRILADGECHSSEQCRKMLRISSAVLSEHIQTIFEWGVHVLVTANKEYYLHSPIKFLNKVEILARLPAGRLEVLSIVHSTNQYLIEHIVRLQSGDACVAEYQVQGRGRRGRKWVSTFGNNLYLSVYWNLEQRLKTITGLSQMAAIVIAEVLQYFGVEDVRIKWPNDLYLDNRKLAGVLVETFNKASGNHIIIGAGINLEMREPIINIIDQDWISLKKKGIIIDRNILSAALINALRQELKQFERSGFISCITRWKMLDNFLNQPVKLLIGEKEVYGIERGIDTQGALLLEQDGKMYSCLNGEIFLRGL